MDLNTGTNVPTEMYERIRSFAVNQTRSFLPDASLGPDYDIINKIICFKSATHGDLTCTCRTAEVQYKSKAPSSDLLLRYLGALIIREARRLSLTAFIARDESLLQDSMACTMISLLLHINAQEERVEGMDILVRGLTKQNEATQRKLMEALDDLCVCQTRLNIIEFGELPPPVPMETTETKEPSHKRMRTEDMEAFGLDPNDYPKQEDVKATATNDAWFEYISKSSSD